MHFSLNKSNTIYLFIYFLGKSYLKAQFLQLLIRNKMTETAEIMNKFKKID